MGRAQVDGRGKVFQIVSQFCLMNQRQKDYEYTSSLSHNILVEKALGIFGPVDLLPAEHNLK